jgi:hypothetical protein
MMTPTSMPSPRPELRSRSRHSNMLRRLRRSRPARWVLGRRRELLTRREIRANPRRFDDVEACCLFIGHVKSGGSLLGAMLDAHPQTSIADEMDVVAQVAAGLDRRQIFTLLLRGARREAQNGRVTARRLVPYSLAVTGQWQGGYERLRVIGDSRAGPTTRALGSDLDRLARLRSVMGETRVGFVHMVRDPYEPISAMVRRSGRVLDDAVDDHRQQCQRLAALRERIPQQDLLTVRYEELVADPRGQLRRVLTFLGLEASTAYLDACAKLVHPEPVRERDAITWTPQAIAAVEQATERYDFLSGYGFDR